MEPTNKTKDDSGATKGLERWKGRVALVTGASSGIGAALVAFLVTKVGMKVAGCARRTENLRILGLGLPEELQSSFFAVKCDVTDERDILQMFSDIKAKWEGVDLMVNNAGTSYPSRENLISGETKLWKQVFDVNVLATLICNREAIASMRERCVDDGQIVNINSTSGHRIPARFGGGVYCASKMALTCLTESLRQELRRQEPRGSHIRVCQISPGIVRTPFAEQSLGGADKAEELYSSLESLEVEDLMLAVKYVLSCPRRVDVNDIIVRPTEQKG